MPDSGKPLVWLADAIRTPPFSALARLEAGQLLRQLQRGEALQMPHSRPMPSIGRQVHELRIQDAEVSWRVIYRIDTDAIVIGALFVKKSPQTPQPMMRKCRRRFRAYDEARRE